MAGYPVHRPASPWHGHRLLRRANIQPSATTGHPVHNADSKRLEGRTDRADGCTQIILIWALLRRHARLYVRLRGVQQVLASS
jgi:hypothetical protein